MFRRVGSFLIYSFALVLIQSYAFAFDDISGLWRHSAKPVVLNLDLESGIVSVKSHNDNLEAAGLTIIRNIEKDLDAGFQWTAEMYNGYIDSYVPVKLLLKNNTTLLVSDAQGTEVLKLYRD